MLGKTFRQYLDKLNITILSSLFLGLISVSIETKAQELNPRVDLGDLTCFQTSGKQFYSDGEVDNIAVDRGPVQISTIRKGRNYPISINGEDFDYASGVAYIGSDGVQRLNMLFTQNSPGLLATKTASVLLYNAKQDLKLHLVYTEPLMGNKRSFVRTSFYDCN